MVSEMGDDSKSKSWEDHGDEKETDSILPQSPFVTTSDIINQLNRQLSNLTQSENERQNPRHLPQFELQKRLPDGSAIPATKDEAAAADFKTKLEQSAAFVSQLESKEDKQRWAEQQRLTGNTFFQKGDYRGAMDMYLTCLVVKENTPDFIRETFLPVLNNLAQCTLQMGMYSKTVAFCDMALEEVAKAKAETQCDKSAPSQQDIADAIALCKIYFKKAKALRLTGHYGSARKSLNYSRECLLGKVETLSTKSSMPFAEAKIDVQMMVVPYNKAIDKEYRYLQAAEKEGKKNHIRQKKAMQIVLSPPEQTKSKMKSSEKEANCQSKRFSQNSLYDKPSTPRQFSQLRAKKPSSRSRTYDHSKLSENGHTTEASYTQFYWNMIARVAKALLVMLGDESEIDGPNEAKKEQ